MKKEITISDESEGTKIDITYGTNDLTELPPKIGVFIFVEDYSSTLKTYFDDVGSLRKMARLFNEAANSIEQ